MDPLSSLFEFAVANWQWLISTILALVSILVAAYFFVKSRRKKSPCHALWSFNVIRDLADKFRNLKITYSRESLKNLTSTKIAFWNAGGETITSQDIPRTNPIAIQVEEGCKIIATKTLSERNLANRITTVLTSDQTQAKIRFDYLNKGEGAVFQVLHTGQSGADIDIRGNVIGVGKISRKKIQRGQYVSSRLTKYISPAKQRLIVALAFFLAPIGLSVLAFYREIVDIAMIIALLLFFALCWAVGLDAIRNRLPEGFGEYEQP